MNIEKIKAFIELARQEGVSALKYENKSEKFEVEFSHKQVESVPHQILPTPSPHLQESEPVAAPAKTLDPNIHEIKSPFVGTFYRQASPEAPPYVEEGSQVSTGTTLCIIEAMKIMNEIETDISGEITEVCVENESYVEYGQVLFKVRKK